MVEVKTNVQTCSVDEPARQLIKITIEPGASETVCNDVDFSETPTVPGEGSRNGVLYMDASGSHIENLGEKKIALPQRIGKQGT